MVIIMNTEYKVIDVNSTEQKVLRKIQTLVIEHDDLSHCNPREWDNMTVFVGREHRNYTIGDEQDEPLDYMVKQLNELGDISDEDMDDYLCSGYSPATADAIKDKFSKYAFWKPVYMYDHSGVSYSTTPFSCGWDSGLAGIILIWKHVMDKEYASMPDHEKVLLSNKIMEKDIELYDQWQSGNGTMFTLYEHWENEEYQEGEAVESCGGFFGSDWETNGVLDYVDYYDEVIENF